MAIIISVQKFAFDFKKFFFLKFSKWQIYQISSILITLKKNELKNRCKKSYYLKNKMHFLIDYCVNFLIFSLNVIKFFINN